MSAHLLHKVDDKHHSHELAVKVEATVLVPNNQLHPDDLESLEDIARVHTYRITDLPETVNQSMQIHPNTSCEEALKALALDLFHSQIPMKYPEHFEVEVRLPPLTLSAVERYQAESPPMESEASAPTL